jgi:putative nucleotidyltransferase with HDIG domain
MGMASLGLIVYFMARAFMARSEGTVYPKYVIPVPARAAGDAPPLKPVPAITPCRPSVTGPIDLSVLTDAPACDERPWEATELGFALQETLQRAEASLRDMKSRRELLMAMSRPGLDARQLSNQVIADPALSAQILRTVNSPFYALPQPMASVFRAVLYLGHIEVRNIVWRTCLTRSLGTVPADTEHTLQDLWRHSFATSRIAYGVAKSVGLESPDAVATAALLHDVGKLIALIAAPADGRRIYEPLPFSRIEDLRQETEAWGVCHTRLGAEMARLWGLPETVVDAIEHHHLPSYQGPEGVPGNPRVLLAVHVSDILAHMRARQAYNAAPYRPNEAWLRQFGLGCWDEILTEPVQRALRFAGVENAPLNERGVDAA